jgi:transposase-like protein
MPRRKFSKEFKEAAVRRLELGASVTEVARAVEVIPNLLHRWRQELRNQLTNSLRQATSRAERSAEC